MDAATILALVTKGITIAAQLYESGAIERAWNAIMALKTVVIDKQNPTQQDIDQCEAVLDALLDEFNAPLPDDVPDPPKAT